MRSLVAFLLVASAPAAANNIGIFGKSGRDADQGTCLQCHYGDTGTPANTNVPPNLPAPTITVDGLDDPEKLIPGGFADLTIHVKTNDASGGIPGAACPDRCGGFNAAVDVGAGQFLLADETIAGTQPVQVNATRDEAAHIAKSPFVDGEVKWHLLLTALSAGDHTLFVSGNDVNGEDFTGDRVDTTTFPFTVAPPPPPKDHPPAGGCAAAGSTNGAALALAGALLLARRSRRRAG